MVATNTKPTLPPLATSITMSWEEHHVCTATKWINKLHASKCQEDPLYKMHLFIQMDRLPDNRPAALTLSTEYYCMIFNLLSLPLSRVAKIFSVIREQHSMYLVAANAATAAAVYSNLYLADGAPEQQKLTPMLLDIQLAHELLDGTIDASMKSTAAFANVAYGKQKPVLPIIGSKKDHLAPFAERARCFRHVFEKINARFGAQDLFQWLTLSTSRVRNLVHAIKTDPQTAIVPIGFKKNTFTISSLDVLEAKDAALSTTVEVKNEREELQKLCQLLPATWADRLMKEVGRQLIDVEIDLGRPPFAFFRKGQKIILSEGRQEVTKEEHLEHIERCLQEQGNGIGKDNRAGINGSLHRVSVMRSARSRCVVGATLRVGRHIYGVSTLLLDVLFGATHKNQSVLLLGSPGSGKTTMGRDIARLLSETQRVVIVDSSEEIGGPGAIPHPCIGDSRRISVPGGKHKLTDTLIEAVENHTPDVILVDELSNQDEVSGAATAKNRGVRVVSSAHGNLRSLVKNGKLRGLIGGLERVTVGDRMVRDSKEKVQALRAGEPVLNVVVEMGIIKDDPSACRIVDDAGKAVDCILKGRQYPCQMRRRDKDGNIIMSKVYA